MVLEGSADGDDGERKGDLHHSDGAGLRGSSLAGSVCVGGG